MARDYQRRANPKQNKKGSAGWKWLVVGLLVGLFAAFLFLLTPKKESVVDEKITATTPPQAMQESRDVKKSAPAQMPPETKPRFEFYTKLPEIEVIIPESEIEVRRREEKSGQESAREYLIQAGSFRQFKDADRRKAQLALLNIEARIEKIQIGSSPWNRVLIGPFTSMRKIDGIRSRLRKSHIDSVVVSNKR